MQSNIVLLQRYRLLKKTSFYFNYCGIKNFSDIPSLPAKPNKGLAFPFAKEDGELFSTLIDYSIFKQCEEIVEKKAFLKNKKVLKQNQKDANSQIPSQYLECLYHLYFYVKLNHLSRCVLCGKAYRGNASLVAHIEEQIKLLKPIDSPDCLDQVRRCAEQILSSIKSKSNNSFSALFSGIKTNTTIQQYNLIRTYYELGKCVGDSVQSSVDAITIDEKGTTIADARKKLTECDEKIQATKKEKATIKRFNNYIEKQISEILLAAHESVARKSP
jgi:hypothetical protein